MGDRGNLFLLIPCISLTLCSSYFSLSPDSSVCGYVSVSPCLSVSPYLCVSPYLSVFLHRCIFVINMTVYMLSRIQN
jgi:hypothetical protein